MINKLKPYNLKESIQIVVYSLCSRIVDSIPKTLRRTYDITANLSTKDVDIRTKDAGTLSLSHKVADKICQFFLKKSSSDTQVFEQIIIKEEYKPLINLIKEYQIEISNFIDCGANIGLTSVYFKAFFPDIKIFALEPSTETFGRMQANMNANGLSEAVMLNKGVWSKNTYLAKDRNFRDREDWSFRLVETDNKADALFETISIDQLKAEYGIQEIDVLKMDIEGGEVDIFKNDPLLWLRNVKIIALEIHDEFGVRDDIEKTLSDNGFKLIHSGELTIGLSKKIISKNLH